MIPRGSFVRLTPEAVSRDRDYAEIGHKIFEVLEWYDGLAWLSCVGQTMQRTVIMGVKRNEMVKVAGKA